MNQAPHYTDEWLTLYHGDCLDVLRMLPDASVDSVCTDPPYGLGFMGKEWDSIKQRESRPPSADETDARFNNAYPRTGKGPASVTFDGLAFQAWCELWAVECLRVLKPGGHMLAFGGTRTSHRLACAIEDAGFEIRDSIAWLYGSGFPKSLDVSKAIDKAAGKTGTYGEPKTAAHASFIGRQHFKSGAGHEGWDRPWMDDPEAIDKAARQYAPATPDAERWQGWGTALKPAHEPVVVARKPLIGTVAANILAHGTGALNVDGCRIEGDVPQTMQGGRKINGGRYNDSADGDVRATLSQPHAAGRWPANVVLDEHQAAALDEQSGERPGAVSNGSKTAEGMNGTATFKIHEREQAPGYGDFGGASRFFYTAKAGSDERPTHGGTSHPTVKPLALMRWLVRLVTPPGGTVLEPFAGSGTTAEACLLERFHCIAIEREADYLPLIVQRITRRRDPIAYLTEAGHDLGLFADQ